MKNSEADDEAVVLSFAQQRELACADGWLQGRYYGEEGDSVREELSFGRVFEICPYEVGVDRRAERKAYAARFKKIVRLMELGDLLERPFNTLSNGEMRRALFARALLKNPKKLVLDDPMAGLDPRQRDRFKRVIKALAKDGVEITMRCRHADEHVGKCSSVRVFECSSCRANRGSCGARTLPLEHSNTPTFEHSNTRTLSHSNTRTLQHSNTPPIIELHNIHVRFGRRVLFDGFSWTVRRGERWVLRGPNGSGKTTLMAMVTGDSPLAYANDVKVFGVPREPGHELAKIRRRIAMVSPEMQTYLGKGPDELLDAALAREPELLILDEPCLNLDAKDARKLLRRVSAWLKARPLVTAIAIVHRDGHVPAGFTREISLGCVSGKAKSNP